MSRLILLLAMVLVGSAALFAHRALAEATPLAVAAWRLGFAGLFFLLWEGADRSQTKESVRLTTGTAWRLAVAGICLALHFLMWFASLQYVSVARSTLLVCTTPLWTALGGLLLRRRAAAATYGPALAIALFGIWLVTRTGANSAASSALLGDVYAVAGGMFFAAYLLLVEGLHATLSTRRQVTATYSVAALALWAVLLLRDGLRLAYSPGVWAAMLGMAIGPQILGHTLINQSLRRFPSSTVAFATLLEPVIAALLAWLLLHQALTTGQIVGGLLVLAGMGVVLWEKKSPVSGDFELVE